jgi:hypothetical protein
VNVVADAAAGVAAATFAVVGGADALPTPTRFESERLSGANKLKTYMYRVRAIAGRPGSGVDVGALVAAAAVDAAAAASDDLIVSAWSENYSVFAGRIRMYCALFSLVSAHFPLLTMEAVRAVRLHSNLERVFSL